LTIQTRFIIIFDLILKQKQYKQLNYNPDMCTKHQINGSLILVTKILIITTINF